MKEASHGKRRLFFVDAAHFVMGGLLGSLWCFTRLFLRTSPGRERLNVLAALDIFQKEIIQIENTLYINSDSVCLLLYKIIDQCKNAPVTLVLDNARYQRCKKVMELAEKLGIELLFLPPYSPNLNLIERFWKFVKKECLYSKYYENFQKFSEAILSCINTAYENRPDELKSLLSRKFQFFKKSQVMNG